MSFGKIMIVKIGKFVVTLKPFTKEEISSHEVIGGMSDHEVTQHTLQQISPTIESQGEWYEKIRTDKNVVCWGIYVDGTLCGVTTIHIDEPFHKGGTGIIIFRKDFWRKGIASTAHIARTWYAVKHLDLKIIITQIHEPNEGSLRALMSVGYAPIGHMYYTEFRNGEYVNRVLLQWVNPNYAKLLFRKGVPKAFVQAQKQAKKTLKKASKLVKYG
jgi:RimJ/RimL family protein N-acetyltransferase